MKMIFLVDGDNNIATCLKGIELLSEEDRVLVFYQKSGMALSKLEKLCAGTKAQVQYIESVRTGKNSIDFQIITELGVLVGRREAEYAYVISQDKGYAASIDALRCRYGQEFREVALQPSIESCVHLPFLRKVATREQLQLALRQECGEVQGEFLYRHLESLFAAPPAAEPEAPEPPKKSRTHRGGRRRKPAAAKVQPAEGESHESAD